MNNVILSRSIVLALAAVFLCAPSPAPAISASCDYTGPPAPPRGTPIGKLRVLAMNVWGQNDDSETKCQARLRYIGERLANEKPLFDVIGLTEVHPDYAFVTCDGEKLVDGLRVNGQYKGKKARWGHPETSALHYDGGTSLFATSEFDWTPYEEHVERYSPKYQTRTAHGFVFGRIPIVRETTGRDGNTAQDHRAGMVDVYVTHLYSKGSGSTACNQECRYRQLQQLARGIHRRSATSGNPVLVMGDFNIGGPNPTADSCAGNTGYGDIMEVLRNPRDLWLEAHPGRKGTTLVDSPQRIDYIFLLTDPYFTNSSKELVLASANDVKLIDWQMPGYSFPPVAGSLQATWKPGPFAVSDHYGIEATLEVQQRARKNEVVKARRGRPSGSIDPADQARSSAAQCSKASHTVCRKAGATCAVVRGRDGSASDLCRWDSAGKVSACSGTAGLWTRADSKYARNHPGAVPPGRTGACISEAANLR